MDKYTKLADAFKQFLISPTTLIVVEVVSIEGDTCTVKVNELDVDGVFLRPITTGKNKVLLTPKVGSHVLVGSLSGDLRQLAVISVDELQKFELASEHISLMLDVENGVVSVKKGDTEQLVVDVANEAITLHGGKLGGLVVVEELVNRLNAIERAFNGLLEDYKQHNHTHAQGSTMELVTPYGAKGVSETSIGDVENKKIRQ